MQTAGAARNEAEVDCRLFWDLSRELQATLEQGGELFEIIDELIALREISDVAVVKRACTRLIDRHQQKAEEQRCAKVWS